VNALVLPGGDPDLLEQLTDQLTRQASQAGDLAFITASAADTYTGFTTAMSHSVCRIPAPLADIAWVVRSYAGCCGQHRRPGRRPRHGGAAGQASGGDTASLQAADSAQADATSAQLEAAGQQAAARSPGLLIIHTPASLY